VRIEPIIPVVHREPFDDPQWLFELKWDGFRGIAARSRHMVAIGYLAWFSLTNRNPSVGSCS
jgi:hypothetical protein